MAHKKAQTSNRKLVRADNSQPFPVMSAPIHRSRYLRHHRDGVSEEDIARQDGVSLATVRQSIRQTTLYYLLSNETEAHAAEWSLVLATNEAQRKALMEALIASSPILDKEGKIVGELPDHAVRLEAMARINEKLEALQPKGRSINVQTNVGINNQVTGGQSGGIYEDRLREIMRMRSEQQSLPAAMLVEEEGDDDTTGSGDEA